MNDGVEEGEGVLIPLEAALQVAREAAPRDAVLALDLRERPLRVEEREVAEGLRHVGLQPGCIALQPGCLGLQAGCLGLQAGCLGLHATCA